MGLTWGKIILLLKTRVGFFYCPFNVFFTLIVLRLPLIFTSEIHSGTNRNPPDDSCTEALTFNDCREPIFMPSWFLQVFCRVTHCIAMSFIRVWQFQTTTWEHFYRLFINNVNSILLQDFLFIWFKIFYYYVVCMMFQGLSCCCRCFQQYKTHSYYCVVRFINKVCRSALMLLKCFQWY